MNPLMPPRSVMLKLLALVAWAVGTAQHGSRIDNLASDPEIREWLAEARKRELLP